MDAGHGRGAFVTRDFFFTAQAVSYAFAVAAVLRIIRSAESAAAAATAFVWLVSSKAFVDYTSSGLEYPLSYCLLALFYCRLVEIGSEPLTARDLRRFGLIAGLAFVNRIDSALLYAVPLAWFTVRTLRRPGERIGPLIVGVAVPVGVIRPTERSNRA